jgi:O-6-methylguanine DNA methyltransferase
MSPVAASPLWQLPVPTADGTFVAGYSEAGLCALRFPGDPAGAGARGKEPPAPVVAWHRLTVAALEAALQGRQPETLPPLDLGSGTGFRRSVWNAMLQLRAGETASYGEIARRIGKPKALRAVGGACGANPIPVLVPCHRVLAAHDRLGGFSSGLDWKRKLLAREGIAPRDNPRNFGGGGR